MIIIIIIIIIIYFTSRLWILYVKYSWNHGVKTLEADFLHLEFIRFLKILSLKNIRSSYIIF